MCKYKAMCMLVPICSPSTVCVFVCPGAIRCLTVSLIFLLLNTENNAVITILFNERVFLCLLCLKYFTEHAQYLCRC